MTEADIHYLLVASIFPVGAVIFGVLVAVLTGSKPDKRLEPGE